MGVDRSSDDTSSSMKKSHETGQDTIIHEYETTVIQSKIGRYSLVIENMEQQIKEINESKRRETGIIAGVGDWVGEKTGSFETGKEIYERQIQQLSNSAKSLHSQILTQFRVQTISSAEQTKIEVLIQKLEKISGSKLEHISWADAVLTSTNGANIPAKYMIRAAFGAIEGAYEGVSGILEITGKAIGILAAYGLEPRARDIIEEDIAKIISQLTIENATKILAILPKILEEFKKLPADKQIEGATKFIAMMLVPLGIGAKGVQVGKNIVETGLATTRLGAKTVARVVRIMAQQTTRVSGASKNAIKVAKKAGTASVIGLALGAGTTSIGATAIAGGSAIRYIGEMGARGKGKSITNTTEKITLADTVAKAESRSGVPHETIIYNANLDDVERVIFASSLLNKELNELQKATILHLHNDISKGVYNNGYKEFRMMITELDKVGFSREEGRKLMENGVLGKIEKQFNAEDISIRSERIGPILHKLLEEIQSLNASGTNKDLAEIIQEYNLISEKFRKNQDVGSDLSIFLLKYEQLLSKENIVINLNNARTVGIQDIKEWSMAGIIYSGRVYPTNIPASELFHKHGIITSVDGMVGILGPGSAINKSFTPTTNLYHESQLFALKEGTIKLPNGEIKIVKDFRIVEETSNKNKFLTVLNSDNQISSLLKISGKNNFDMYLQLLNGDIDAFKKYALVIADPGVTEKNFLARIQEIENEMKQLGISEIERYMEHIYTLKYYSEEILESLSRTNYKDLEKIYTIFIKNGYSFGEVGLDAEKFSLLNKKFGITRIEWEVMTSWIGTSTWGSNNVNKVRDFYQKIGLTIMDSVIRKLPNYEGKAYRGLSFKTEDVLNQFIENINKSNESIHNFTSDFQDASRYAQGNYGAIIEIQSKGGHILPQGLSSIEEHVWFERGKSFRISRIDRSTTPIRIILDPM